MIASKRIFRYVKGTLDFSVTLIPQLASATLSTYFGANWAGCPNARRSIIGYLVYLDSNLISWCSKKQPIVFHLSLESEYRTLSHACVATI